MTIPHEHMYIDCYAVKSYIDGIITFFSLLSMCSRISMADASALTRITLRPFNIALKSFTRKSLISDAFFSFHSSRFQVLGACCFFCHNSPPLVKACSLTHSV